MSVAGVRQLKTLTIRYCQFGGSSKGVREFLATKLADFQNANPSLFVKVVAKNGHHPILIGEYRHPGLSKQVCVKNLAAVEISDRALFLRNQLGTKAKTWSKRHWTHYPSVQGQWTGFRQKPVISLQYLDPSEASAGSRLVESV